jgi:DNA-binding NarL/FixJ family response regulator
LAVTRIALLGGSTAIREPRRAVLESQPSFQIVYDSDGFGISAMKFAEVNFDVAIIEQRLSVASAFEFIKELHTQAGTNGVGLGRLLVSSQFHETDLRLKAISAGAVDCTFVSDGFESLIRKVSMSSLGDADFAMREMLPTLEKISPARENFQSSSVALDSLDAKTSKVLRSFCQMIPEDEISQAVGLSIVKVRAALTSVQKMLGLSTRSQLLLHMFQIGELAL